MTTAVVSTIGNDSGL